MLGEKVAPEDRISLEGVTAEYLANMSDAEYLDALHEESCRYMQASTELNRQAADLDDPAGKAERDAKLSGKPSLADKDEAKSVLSTYTDTLLGLIDTRNSFYSYLQSDNAREYLVARFGDDGAKEQIGQIQRVLDEHDKQIEATVESLNAIFNLTGAQPIATKQDGVWSLNSFTGLYSGGSFVYSFEVNEQGAILGK